MRTLVFLFVTSTLVAADFPSPEKLPAQPGLPDPLVSFAGEKVTTKEAWEKQRKPELKALFEHYMYGKLPATQKVEAKVLYEDVNAFGDKGILQEVRLQIGPKEWPPIYLLVAMPKQRNLLPVFVGMNFSGNHALVADKGIRLPTTWMYPSGKGVKDNKATEDGRGTAIDTWSLQQAVDRGYAVATFYNGDVDPDRKDIRGGLSPFVVPPKKGEAAPDDTATIMLWAWGIHRAVDYLVTLPEIDKKKIAVVGHSRLGKTALLAAAFDERITLAIPHQAGCGGTAPNRTKDPKAESVARINNAFPHWFCGNFKAFDKDVEKLPFDQHCLAALCAPRPILFTNAVEDQWANPNGQFDMLKAAEPVYKLFGAGGLADKERPESAKLSAGTLGYYIREGKHSMTKEDWKVFLDYADRQWKR